MKQEEKNMKIAVTTEGDQIFQHFGKCPTFTVFTVKDGAVQGKTSVDASRNGHAALSGFLKSLGVDVVICGGIGDGAKQMLSSAGIKLVSGIEGGIENAVNAYLSGNLTDKNGTCSREEHTQEHPCDCKDHQP
jgi:predicted Fe-Mo cluster-binding NifX family protein